MKIKLYCIINLHYLKLVCCCNKHWSNIYLILHSFFKFIEIFGWVVCMAYFSFTQCFMSCFSSVNHVIKGGTENYSINHSFHVCLTASKFMSITRNREGLGSKSLYILTLSFISSALLIFLSSSPPLHYQGYPWRGN